MLINPKKSHSCRYTRMATPTTPVKELPKEMLIGDRLKG